MKHRIAYTLLKIFNCLSEFCQKSAVSVIRLQLSSPRRRYVTAIMISYSANKNKS